MSKDPSKMSLQEHAIAWWTEKDRAIPDLDSPEWDDMYCEWVEYAFETI